MRLFEIIKYYFYRFFSVQYIRPQPSLALLDGPSEEEEETEFTVQLVVSTSTRPHPRVEMGQSEMRAIQKGLL